MRGSSALARAVTTISTLSLLLGGLLPISAASAATTLGHTQSDPFANCSAGDNMVQGVSTSPSYEVPPGGGVITAWSHSGRNAPTAGQGKLIVWRPTGDPSQFSVVGKGASQAFTPNVKLTFPTRIPVSGGDVLGMRAESANVACWVSLQVDGMRISNGADPSVGSTLTFGSEQGTQNVNVEATLEADADGDGFGDESQDNCVGQAGSDNGCPAAPVGLAPTDKPEPGSRGSLIELRKISVRGKGQLRLVPTCQSGRYSARLRLPRLLDDGSQVGGGKAQRFRCRRGRVSFTKSSGFIGLPRAWWRAAHTGKGLVLLATIERSSDEPDTMPLWFRTGRGGRTGARAPYTGTGLSCHSSQGGGGYMFPSISATFDWGRVRPTEYVEVEAWAQTWNGGYSRWQASTRFQYRQHTSGITLPGTNLSVVGGSLGVGGASYLQWGGTNGFRVGRGSWAHIWIWIWTARTGWFGDYLQPEVFYGTRGSGEWCGF